MKIGPISVILIGVMVGVIALSFGYFSHWKPKSIETQRYREYREVLAAEHAKGPQAVRRVEDAVRKRNRAMAEWREIVATRTPPIDPKAGGIDLGYNGWELVNVVHEYRNNIQVALNRQLKAGGVTVVNGPTIPNPPQEPNAILGNYFNYPAIPYPVVIFDLGQVTVRGNFKQITDHVQAWSNMPRYLAVTDRLAFTGTSPNLTGTYNLTIVGFVRGKRLFPPVPTGGVALQRTPPPPPGGGAANPAQPGGNQPAPATPPTR